MHFTVVIAGAGPAGLACAKILAENSIDVLVLERKIVVGPKVCAGGITWSGLINRIPGQLEEKRFLSQHICTRLQRTVITEKEPIIATINRGKLGQHMARAAIHAGAKIKTGCQIQTVRQNSIIFLDLQARTRSTVTFDYLVGADGSNSLVRRFLHLPVEKMGIGINYQIPRYLQNMEWHINSDYFGNGYGWIFPHSDSASVGAYADRSCISAQRLQAGLLSWAAGRGIDLSRYRAQAENVNYDYRGWRFDNIFLAGDAAGFASGLTGEGIYPAMVSGEYIARCIAERPASDKSFLRLLRMQKLHAGLARLTGSNRFIASSLAELVTLGLRSGILDFRKLEMAH